MCSFTLYEKCYLNADQLWILIFVSVVILDAGVPNQSSYLTSPGRLLWPEYCDDIGNGFSSVR